MVITDTAGLRETRDMVELEGMARSLAAATSAHLLLLVLDASAEDLPSLAEPQALRSLLSALWRYAHGIVPCPSASSTEDSASSIEPGNTPLVVLVNKCDLLEPGISTQGRAWEASGPSGGRGRGDGGAAGTPGVGMGKVDGAGIQLAMEERRVRLVRVSCRTGEGLDEAARVLSEEVRLLVDSGADPDGVVLVTRYPPEVSERPVHPSPECTSVGGYGVVLAQSFFGVPSLLLYVAMMHT